MDRPDCWVLAQAQRERASETQAAFNHPFVVCVEIHILGSPCLSFAGQLSGMSQPHFTLILREYTQSSGPL